ncbi:ABC transporter ATP-binding protein [Gemella sp. 19428wG2_WT2a]|nr:ABC transporter ATP-binding protein [Gemella sp. 19428wG2_WT2a]TFU60162.1 ABC transporter ATP-binding protein [Gemella sp. WT2a]
MSRELIKLENINKVYESKDFRGNKYRTVALNNINISINEGETLGLVGESGSGKSTLGKVILGFETATSGNIDYSIDKKSMQIIFQDPYSALNPKMSALELVMEAMFYEKDKKKVKEKAIEFLDRVGIRGDDIHKKPKYFSGGQRQRICIARAVISNPKFIICDEPTSALDVSIQSQILELLSELQKDWNLSYLFISHDLSVVRHISDRVAVMYRGNLVELADAEDLYNNPQHSYTKKLLNSIFEMNPAKARKLLAQEEVDEKIELSENYEWKEVSKRHFVRLDK